MCVRRDPQSIENWNPNRIHIHTIDEIEFPARKRHTSALCRGTKSVAAGNLCVVTDHCFVSLRTYSCICEETAKQQHQYTFFNHQSRLLWSPSIFFFFFFFEVMHWCTQDDIHVNRNQKTKIYSKFELRRFGSEWNGKYFLAQFGLRETSASVEHLKHSEQIHLAFSLFMST